MAPAVEVRRNVETATGADLSSVRVHTGSASQRAAAAIQAKAYTTGSNIHFAAGQYQPGTPSGDHLLAHEMVHTLQQTGDQATQRKPLAISQPHDPAELEADRIADIAGSGKTPVAPIYPVQRASSVSRTPETLSGNPQDRTNAAGNPTTNHRAPTINDAINHAAPTAAASEERTANVRVVADESSPLHLEPPGTPHPTQVYEESTEQTSPPASGFTTVTRFQGTIAQPQIQEEADNSLFIEGQPTANDVQQMSIGDCYFLAALMSVVSRDPGKITSMMTADGSGGASVTLWRRQDHAQTIWERIMGGGPQYDYIPVQVQVSNQLAFNISNGRVHGAQLRCAPAPRSSDYWAKLSGDNLAIHRKDVYECARWAPLLEKAYARFSETHDQYGGARTGGGSGASGYNAIDGGWSYKALCVFYGPDADAADSNLHQENITWTPGGNVLTANPAVVDQLVLLAGRGEQTAPGQTDAPIVTATAMVNPLIGRLQAAITAAMADPDWVNVSVTRQNDVTAVSTAITAWNALPPDPAPPAAQPKAAARRAVGNACATAARPGPDENPGEAASLAAIRAANPTPVRFSQGDDAVSAAANTGLTALGTQLTTKRHPIVNVNVQGHASSEGTEENNQALSQRRADNVSAAITAGGAIAPHTLATVAAGEAGAAATPEWRRVDIAIDPLEPRNSLHDPARSTTIRGMMDLMIDLRNIGTDASQGQRNIYGDHVYSVVGVNFVTTTGETVPIQSIPAQYRPLLYSLIDTNVSTVRLRNPHHGNEPDRLGNNQPTNPGDGTPSGSSSDGIFTMSFEEFFRNFNHVDSGVFRRS